MTDCPLIITADPELLDQALTAVAAAGAEATIAPDLAAAQTAWRDATVVLLGVDQAPALAGLSSRSSPVRYLLGAESDREQLCGLSAQLSCAVAILPEHRAELTVAIRDQHVATTRGGMVALLGTTGGVGTSTLAAGLAWAAHDSGTSTALVDLDPYGGGLDLALGIESEPGWRWPQLVGVTGQVTAVADRLPALEGMPILAASRQEVIEEPTPQVVHDVLASIRVDHEGLVVDLGQRLSTPTVDEVTGTAQRVLCLVRDDVRGVAAAEAQLKTRPETTADWQLVVCGTTRSAGLPETEIAAALGRDLVAVVPYDRRLSLALLQGHLPARAASKRWRRAISQLAKEIWP